MNEKTATFIKDVSENFNGRAHLYRLNPPLKEFDWDDELVGEHEYVVVSAANAMFSGPETYIFQSDENGNVIKWGELDGSYRGGLSHEVALSNAGYEIAQPMESEELLNRLS